MLRSCSFAVSLLSLSLSAGAAVAQDGSEPTGVRTMDSAQKFLGEMLVRDGVYWQAEEFKRTIWGSITDVISGNCKTIIKYVVTGSTDNSSLETRAEWIINWNADSIGTYTPGVAPGVFIKKGPSKIGVAQLILPNPDDQTRINFTSAFLDEKCKFSSETGF